MMHSKRLGLLICALGALSGCAVFYPPYTYDGATPVGEDWHGRGQNVYGGPFYGYGMGHYSYGAGWGPPGRFAGKLGGDWR